MASTVLVYNSNTPEFTENAIMSYTLHVNKGNGSISHVCRSSIGICLQVLLCFLQGVISWSMQACIGILTQKCFDLSTYALSWRLSVLSQGNIQNLDSKLTHLINGNFALVHMKMSQLIPLLFPCLLVGLLLCKYPQKQQQEKKVVTNQDVLHHLCYLVKRSSEEFYMGI